MTSEFFAPAGVFRRLRSNVLAAGAASAAAHFIVVCIVLAAFGGRVPEATPEKEQPVVDPPASVTLPRTILAFVPAQPPRIRRPATKSLPASAAAPVVKAPVLPIAAATLRAEPLPAPVVATASLSVTHLSVPTPGASSGAQASRAGASGAVAAGDGGRTAGVVLHRFAPPAGASAGTTVTAARTTASTNVGAFDSVGAGSGTGTGAGTGAGTGSGPSTSGDGHGVSVGHFDGGDRNGGHAPVDASFVEILYKPSPEYTERARAQRLEGSVEVEVEFLATGSIRILRVVRGLGGGLDEMATQAVAGIKFNPARTPSGPITVKKTVLIVFKLA